MDEIEITDRHNEKVVALVRDRIIEFNIAATGIDQAPAFYARLGSKVVGQVAGTPLGHGEVFLSTALGGS